jgi:hypothetical protein
MHRRSAVGRLAKRGRGVPVIGPAAHLVVRTGVRATYRIHDRFLSNPAAEKKFAEHPPELDADQPLIVESLRSEGLAVVPFARLFGQGSWWAELGESSAEFARSIEVELREEGSRPGGRRAGPRSSICDGRRRPAPPLSPSTIPGCG